MTFSRSDRYREMEKELDSLQAIIAEVEQQRDALARMVWRLTKGKQPMDKDFPFDPDYTFVTKSDLAMVLTVYEAATPDPANRGVWYDRCKEALDWPTPLREVATAEDWTP